MKATLLKNPREKYSSLPMVPGVYIMKDAAGRFLYIGKAANLRRRVASYFTRPHDRRIERLMSEVVLLEYHALETPIEALILEARLIREHQPIFNVKEKDDKSFLFVEITDEKFPRIRLVRGTEPVRGERFGPFTSTTSIRAAYRIVRKLFRFNVHSPEKIGTALRPCFEYQIGLCPGTCIGAITAGAYKKTVKNVRLFFEGKKQKIVRALMCEMKTARDAQDFEGAEQYRRQIFSLQHIRDVALIGEDEPSFEIEPRGVRIEGYDISHISGSAPVGSMVVFYGGEPEKKEYRKFKIRTVAGPNDTAMLAEVLSRRLRHSWALPQCIMVDGGTAQVNAANEVLRDSGYSIPVVGVAKGPERKRNDIIGAIPSGVTEEMLIRVRDEAHRFAVAYHRVRRSAEFK